MIRLKDSTVKLAGLKPEMDTLLSAIDPVFGKYILDTVITAGTEEFNATGELIHSPSSYHPRGYALDIRSRDIPDACWAKFITDIRAGLKSIGVAYQLIIHKTHFHFEYDLKVAFKKEN